MISTGQKYAEGQQLDWLYEKVIPFKQSDVVYGMSQLLIPTPYSEVEVKDLQGKINKIGAEVLAREGIVYISIPRAAKFSLLTQGAVMIITSVLMNLSLLGFMLYF
jgi:hypothetical protein